MLKKLMKRSSKTLRCFIGRKRRTYGKKWLWENTPFMGSFFLVDQLDFSWDREYWYCRNRLEHIKSENWSTQLTIFKSTEDPHGDPNSGLFHGESLKSKKQFAVRTQVKLQFVVKIPHLISWNISLNKALLWVHKPNLFQSFDLSLKIKVDAKELDISNKINLFLYNLFGNHNHPVATVFGFFLQKNFRIKI
jgi:hypothetical protein